ncbi:MAG: hypothetical protein JM58_09550 [Peptococcaceae bacterium BICA1-8]|nr:MAG: hypothetical protein JM58_09550 [Peptococcaceae bacterium BICA1-8]
MNHETVKKCCEYFESKTGRKITLEEADSILHACVIGESYGCKKFVNATREQKARRNKKKEEKQCSVGQVFF